MSGRWLPAYREHPNDQHITRSDFNAARCQQTREQPEPGPCRLVVAVRQPSPQDRGRDRSEVADRLYLRCDLRNPDDRGANQGDPQQRGQRDQVAASYQVSLQIAWPAHPRASSPRALPSSIARALAIVERLEGIFELRG